jgi:hypothetical protein
MTVETGRLVVSSAAGLMASASGLKLMGDMGTVKRNIILAPVTISHHKCDTAVTITITIIIIIVVVVVIIIIVVVITLTIKT